MITFTDKLLKKGSAIISPSFEGLGFRENNGYLRITAVAFFLCLAGCPSSPSSSPKTAEKLPLAGVKLKLAVAGDPELAAAVSRLQGEWNSQTGAEVQVLQITENDLAQCV